MPVSKFPSVDELELLLSRARSEGASAIVLQRIECLLFYRKCGLSVSAVCRQYSIARGTFYRVVRALDIADWRTLLPASRCPKSLPQTHLPEPVSELVRSYRHTFPTIGKEAIRLRLEREHNVHVSASAIGRLIARENLFFADSLLHERKRSVSAVTNGTEAKPNLLSLGRRYVLQILGITTSIIVIALSLMLGMRQDLRSRTSEMPPLHTAAMELNVPSESSLQGIPTESYLKQGNPPVSVFTAKQP